MSILVLVAGASALGLLLLWAMLALEVGATSGDFGWLITGLLLSTGVLFASITVHEVGHLLAALAVRLRIFLVILGPVKFVRDGNRFRFGVNWRSTVPGCVVALPSEGCDLRRRMLFYISAGPLANLLLGLLLLGAAIHWNEPSTEPRRLGELSPAEVPWMPQNHVVVWLYFAAVMNLMLFAQNLIPGTVGTLRTDGGQILGLLRSDHGAVRQLLLLSLIATSTNGVRPRDWDRTLLERILAGSEGSADDVAANLYSYYHALDRGQIEDAGRHLDQAVALRKLLLAELQPSVLLESAYFVAFHRRDPVAARAALDLAVGGVVEKQSRLRAEAAVLLAEGHKAEAAAKAREGLDITPESVDRGGALAEGEWLAALLAECERDPTPAVLPARLTSSPGPPSARP